MHINQLLNKGNKLIIATPDTFKDGLSALCMNDEEIIDEDNKLLTMVES
jgi:hypothetical protein